MVTNLDRLASGARVALSSTFRERAHLPGSPWFAFLAPAGGIIVDRTDNPEAPIPEAWRIVCRIRNDRTDDANVAAILEALGPVPHLCEARAEYLRTAGLAAFNVRGAVRTRRNGHATAYLFADGSRFIVGRAGWHRYHGTDGKPYAERTAQAT